MPSVQPRHLDMGEILSFTHLPWSENQCSSRWFVASTTLLPHQWALFFTSSFSEKEEEKIEIIIPPHSKDWEGHSLAMQAIIHSLQRGNTPNLLLKFLSTDPTHFLYWWDSSEENKVGFSSRPGLQDQFYFSWGKSVWSAAVRWERRIAWNSIYFSYSFITQGSAEKWQVLKCNGKYAPGVSFVLDLFFLSPAEKLTDRHVAEYRTSGSLTLCINSVLGSNSALREAVRG